jgi:RHS repeat-associated protein
LAALLFLAAGGAQAQSAGTLLAGPFSATLPSTQSFSFSRSFSTSSGAGSYVVRMQLSAPNSLSTLSATLNGTQVFRLSDFAAGVTSADRVATLAASNTLAVQVAGAKGTTITVSVFTLVMPKPVSLTPSPLALTAGRAQGTLTATLSPAPTAAGTLAVTSANSAVATVPASVAFAAGQTSVALPVSGLASGSTTIRVSANGGQAAATVNVNAAPTVSMTAPANNAVFAAGASIALNAAAADSDGTVAKVEFYDGATLLGRALAAPYGATLASAPAGSHTLTAVATDNLGASTTSAALSVTVDSPPAVSLSAPVNNAVFAAPASITLSASATDAVGRIAKVDFYQGATLIGTASASPYTFAWTNVAAGSYSLTAVATNDAGQSATSAAIAITVRSAVAQLYYIHVDHLNTPRLVADATGTTVWRWDQQEPFGNNVADEHPSGLGTFDLPLRLPGQYYERETARHQNNNRNYDPSIGRYEESDLIGLKGGLNTYTYGNLAPLMYTDPTGLAVWYCTRHMRDSYIPVANHAYFFDDKTNRCCGDPGYGAKDPLKSCRERGPGKDSCVLISSSDSDAQQLLQCCNKKTNENYYWPFFNDCHNVGEDCIREIGMAPPNTADENRWKRCPSCWRK